MKFSIVTLSFNQGWFLEQSIRSVLNQDYPDVEYIVVDPGSTDGSRKIIEKYRDRIDVVVLEPDCGPADGLNKGFERASGNILGYINADDALLPGALKRVAEAFDQYLEADVITGHLYRVDQDNRILMRQRATRFDPRRYVFGGVQVAQQSTFFRAAAYEEVGGFNRDNRTSWDAELLLEMSLGGFSFQKINEYLALFRVHAGSISGSGRLEAEHLKDRERLFVRVMGRRPKPPDGILTALYRLDKWRRDPWGLCLRVFDALPVPRTHRRVITI